MDWKQLIEELNKAGLSQAEIAERCESSQAAVSDLARGATKEPRWGLGNRLTSLHAEITRAQGAKAAA